MKNGQFFEVRLKTIIRLWFLFPVQSGRISLLKHGVDCYRLWKDFSAVKNWLFVEKCIISL